MLYSQWDYRRRNIGEILSSKCNKPNSHEQYSIADEIPTYFRDSRNKVRKFGWALGE
jgi:hypothetical protein